MLRAGLIRTLRPLVTRPLLSGQHYVVRALRRWQGTPLRLLEEHVELLNLPTPRLQLGGLRRNLSL